MLGKPHTTYFPFLSIVTIECRFYSPSCILRPASDDERKKRHAFYGYQAVNWSARRDQRTQLSWLIKSIACNQRQEAFNVQKKYLGPLKFKFLEGLISRCQVIVFLLFLFFMCNVLQRLFFFNFS